MLPAGIPLDEQIELANGCMRSLSGIVKRTEELELRDQQLQSMKEIMELRTVTDQKHRSPLDMIEAFVDRLREMAQADRAVLFLANGDGKALVQTALPLRSRPIGDERQETRGTGSHARGNRRSPAASPSSSTTDSSSGSASIP